MFFFFLKSPLLFKYFIQRCSGKKYMYTDRRQIYAKKNWNLIYYEKQIVEMLLRTKSICFCCRMHKSTQTMSIITYTHITILIAIGDYLIIRPEYSLLITSYPAIPITQSFTPTKQQLLKTENPRILQRKSR